MLEVTQLRNGMCYEEGGAPLEVLLYEHIKMGRGGATVKIKVRNMLTGAIILKSYQSGKRVEEADIQKAEGTYLYRTNEDYVFETEEEKVEIPLENLSDQGSYLTKGMQVKILFYEDEPISISLPIKAEYVVKEAPPDARGNSVSVSYKEVILENNVKVKTPMFVKDGDKIIVDTRTGEYVSRA